VVRLIVQDKYLPASVHILSGETLKKTFAKNVFRVDDKKIYYIDG